jgi:hypothetical protein
LTEIFTIFALLTASAAAFLKSNPYISLMRSVNDDSRLDLYLSAISKTCMCESPIKCFFALVNAESTIFLTLSLFEPANALAAA